MALITDARDIVLRPGEYAVAAAGSRIRTVLGSCVSITLWEPRLRIGAMSHFLLAQRGTTVAGGLDARYGGDSLELMLDDLVSAGVAPERCQAKIFGGGHMFPDRQAAQTLQVGRRNGEAARGLLLAHGLQVVAESLFGCGHRQIAFDVASGDVWVRLVPPQSGFGPLPEGTA